VTPPVAPFAAVPPDLPEAMDAALRYLARAARSRWELRRYLIAEGFGAVATEVAEARLVELGILDDAALARAAVEKAIEHRREAPALVAVSLAARGVPDEIAAAALAEAAADRNYDGGLDGALQAAAARLRALRGDPHAVRRRLAGYLARRGYDPETCEEACARLLGDVAGEALEVAARGAEADGWDERAGGSGSWGRSVR